MEEKSRSRSQATSEKCAQGAEYFHILCDNHEVILSNGLPTETLHLGDVAQASFGPRVIDLLFESMPDFRDRGPQGKFQTALPCARRHEAEVLARILTGGSCAPAASGAARPPLI